MSEVQDQKVWRTRVARPGSLHGLYFADAANCRIQARRADKSQVLRIPNIRRSCSIQVSGGTHQSPIVERVGTEWKLRLLSSPGPK
jgi:hypothetical protein